MKETEPLPGAAFFAKAIERRRFLRKAATSLFYGSVAVASGAVSLSTFLANPAMASGACCPSCCGPSPCCETNCCSKNCCAAAPNQQNCLDNAACNGFDTRFYANACWTCVNGTLVTHCCDCHTVDEVGCSNPYADRRCICFKNEILANVSGKAHRIQFYGAKDRRDGSDFASPRAGREGHVR